MSPFPLTGCRNGLISPQSHSSTSPPVSKSQLSKEEKFRVCCGLEGWGMAKLWHPLHPRGDTRRDLLCVFGWSWQCDRSGNGPAVAHSPSPPELPPCGAGTGCLLLESTRAFKPPPLIKHLGGYSEVRYNQPKFYMLFFTLQN